MNKELKKTLKIYDSRKIEFQFIQKWEKSGLFISNNKKLFKKYKTHTIIMPPPNITGILHNGHALFVTLQDILIRYYRMKKCNTLWLPGIDHAGIATQTIVQNKIKKKKNKKKKNNIRTTKTEILKKIWNHKKKNEKSILYQLKCLGASADWSKFRFTMDKKSSYSTRYAFVKMWNKKLIYRSQKLINWDPISKTAISNEEIKHIKVKDKLWKFAYKIKNNNNSEIIVATTRLETMIGDTAIAVNPNDPRYQELIGKYVNHPFFKKRKIKIIADNSIDKNFGTGAVKITPCHDHNDFIIGKKHHLEFINIFSKNYKIKKSIKKFSNMDITDAKMKIKKYLIKMKLNRGHEHIIHYVKISQRSGARIEPTISKQYFLKTTVLAKKALKKINKNYITIIPNNWIKTLKYFLNNIEDWCISRQLIWGHKIPIFYNIKKMKKEIIQYSKKNKLIIESAQNLIERKADKKILKTALRELQEGEIQKFSVTSINNLLNISNNYIQEKDVLDTWFSSALWPFSVFGWPFKTNNLKTYYPTTALETGSDILFFWIAKMIILGISLTRKSPFTFVYLHSMIRDSRGRKMSKSDGNAIDPIDVINGISKKTLIQKIKKYPIRNFDKTIKNINLKYSNGIKPSGTDGLRFSLAIMSGKEKSINLDLSRVNGYKLFLNKIWNASRLILSLKDKKLYFYKTFKKQQCKFSFIDKWIISEIQMMIKVFHQNLFKFQIHKIAEQIYHFFWHKFCDWYLEFSKINLKYLCICSMKNKKINIILKYTLKYSLLIIHPFTPFISEDIWNNLNINNKQQFCATSVFPKYNKSLLYKKESIFTNILINKISLIRNIKKKYKFKNYEKIQIIFFLRKTNEANYIILEKKSIEEISGIQDLKISLKSELSFFKNILDIYAGYITIAIIAKNIKKNLLIKNINQKIKIINRSIKDIQKIIFNKNFIEKAKNNIIKEKKQKYKKLKNERKIKNIFLKKIYNLN
jgi:valyl-tRNA synthetase